MTEPSQDAPESAAASRSRHAATVRWRRPPRLRPSPATSDRVYTDDEREFLQAIEAYKQRTGTRFPTWCEVLALLRQLGYRKPEPPGQVKLADGHSA